MLLCQESATIKYLIKKNNVSSTLQSVSLTLKVGTEKARRQSHKFNAEQVGREIEDAVAKSNKDLN